jgi:uncharacterized protein
MEVTQRIVVPGRPADVWAFVTDLPAVLPCVPGAAVAEDLGDGRYRATITVSAGEFSVSFEGIASIEVAGERTSTILASGGDRMRTLHAEAQVRLDLADAAGDATTLDVTANFDFSGVLSPAARAGGKPAAGLLIRKFGACLVARFRAPVA